MRVVRDIAMRISIFLSVVMAGACLSSASSGQTVGRIGAGVPMQTPSSQSLISWSDFAYAGAYQVPRFTLDESGDTLATLAFTGRYVSGTLHFIGVTSNNGSGEVGFYEFDLDGQAPGTGSTALGAETSLPSARMLQDYGNTANHDGVTNITYKQGASTNGGADGCATFFGNSSLWSIRAIGNRLYWAYGSQYPGDPACYQDGGLGFSTLGTYPAPPSNPHSYILDGNGYKAGEHGFVEVPASWSNGTYPNLTGMTVAQATGGYESIISIGGTSLGPSLIPFLPPAGTEAQRTAISYYPLMQFQSGGTCSNRSAKPVVSPPFENVNEGCSSTIFGTMDSIRGAEWINTTHRRGLLHFVEFSTDMSLYSGANINAMGFVNQVLITDPNSLIPVATGAVAAGTVDWGTNTIVQWPFYDYTTPCGGFIPCITTSVSALTSSGAMATLTVADSSTYSTGSRMVVIGTNEAEYQGTYRPLSIPDSTHITYCSGGNGGTIDDITHTCIGSAFTNTVGTGTIIIRQTQAGGTAYPTGVLGSWFDTTTNVLWLYAANNLQRMVVYKYTCAAC